MFSDSPSIQIELNFPFASVLTVYFIAMSGIAAARQALGFVTMAVMLINCPANVGRRHSTDRKVRLHPFTEGNRVAVFIDYVVGAEPVAK